MRSICRERRTRVKQHTVVDIETIESGKSEYKAVKSTHDQPVKPVQLQGDAISEREIDIKSNENSSSKLSSKVLRDSISEKLIDPFWDLDDLVTKLDALITVTFFRFQLAKVRYLAVKLQDLYREKEAEERFRIRRFMEDIPNSDLEGLECSSKSRADEFPERKSLLWRVWKI